MSYSVYEDDAQEHECIQKLLSVCIHVLVQRFHDELCSRSEQLLDSKHSQKSDLCVCETENITAHSDVYTGCNRRNVRDFGRVFLMLNYTDITQNTYIQS